MSVPEPSVDAQQFWEQLYRDSELKWSGRVNARLAEIAGSLPRGRALDLGCGEGGDACWLAERGWRVAAVDIAPTALARAAAAAGSRNLASRIDFSATTCRIVFLPGRSIWCRISSCILRLASTARGVLRNAARAVAPNGTLLIVDHGSAPPWAWNLAHEHYFPSAEEVVASLSLNADQWQRLRVGSAERQATGPDGQHATVTDNLIALRRIG